MAEQKLKTASAPVAKAQRKSISNQVSSGLKANSNKSVPSGGSYATAHRTVSQSSTYKSTNSVSGGFAPNTVKHTSSFEGANKTINTPKTAQRQSVSSPTPTPTPKTAQRQSVSSPTPTSKTAQRQSGRKQPQTVQRTSQRSVSSSTTRSQTIQNNRTVYRKSPKTQLTAPSGKSNNWLKAHGYATVRTANTTGGYQSRTIQTSSGKINCNIPSYNNVKSINKTTMPKTAITKTVSPRPKISTSDNKGIFSSYHNRKVSKSAISGMPSALKVGGREVLNGVQRQLTRHSDDLATQSINAVIGSARIGATVFKSAQLASNLVTPAMSMAVRGTISASIGVTKQVGLTAVTMSQSYNVMKAMNISPISKQAVGLIKANAISTGLTDTKISHVIRGTVLAGVGVTKQVGLTAVTMSQSYNVMKAMNISPISKQAVGLIKANAISTGLTDTKISQSVSKAVATTAQNVTAVGKGIATGITTGAKGVYQVATTAGLATVTVARAYNISKAMNTFPVSAQGMQILKTSAVQTGLANTQISKAIVKGVANAQTQIVTGVNTIRTQIVTGVNLAKDTLKNSVNAVKVMTKSGIQTLQYAGNVVSFTVRGVAKGTVSLGYVSYQLQNFATLKAGQGIQTLWKGIRGTAKNGLKATTFIMPKVFTVSKGGMKIAKFGFGGIKGGALTVANILGGASDDMAIQGVATALKTADVAGRLSVSALKTSVGVGKGVGKAGIKTVRVLDKVGMTFWQSYCKTNSLIKAFQNVGYKGFKGIGALLKNAGGSMLNAVLGALKAMGKKVIIPILIIICCAMGGMSVLQAPITIVSTIFSGIFGATDDDDPDVETEFDVEEYLFANVPPLTAQTRQDIADDMFNDWKANGGAYDIVRLKEVGGGSNVVEPTLEGVTEIFYTDAEVVDMLEAIFNVKLLMDYDLTPTKSQAKNLLKDLYNKIFTVETVESTEWCGQNLKTGEGTPLPKCSDVNMIHAIISGENTCPNQLTGTHTTQTDIHCDKTYYICDGHVTNNCTHVCGAECGMACIHDCSASGCNTTTYHSNDITVNGVAGMSTACSNCTEHFYCKGYRYCNSHLVNTYFINLDGLYAILQETFYDPIEALEAIPEAERTEEEKQQLSDLYDYLEIYEIMANEVFQGTFGGGMTIDDLSGIDWIENPYRTANADVINLALTQVGNKGGQPYWSYYGFTKRVEWCACFVHWCMRNTPSATNAYPTTANNAYCQTIANHLSSAGQFGHDYNNIVKGDVVFFDWQCDGHTDHIGLVIGRDSEYLYTVEGNSGDAVKIKKYALTSSVIYGYGYLNY